MKYCVEGFVLGFFFFDAMYVAVQMPIFGKVTLWKGIK